MTNNLKLLFVASQYRIGKNDKSLLEELAQKEDFEWAHVFLLARHHKVLPRVWKNISIALPSVVPDGIKKNQKALIRQHTLNCMATVGQLCTFSSLLEKHDIVHVPYKGPVLACYLFDDFSMRSYGDLDILISTADLPQVYSLLTTHDYTPEVEIPQGQLFAYAAVEDNLTFVSGRGIPIEIHWELSGRYLAKPIGLEHVSQNLSSLVMQGRVFPVFSPEDHLVYLCLHGTKHCWAELDLVACLAELLVKETEISWERVFKVAEEFKCLRMVYIGLLLAHKIYIVRLPKQVIAIVDKDKKAAYLTERIIKTMQETAKRLGGNEGAPQDARFSLFRFHVRDSRVDAVRYLLRIMFCPSKSEWKAIRLPTWLFFGYWLARPLRVLWSTIVGSCTGKWHHSN